MKISNFTFLLIAVFSLASCGGGGGNSEETSTPEGIKISGIAQYDFVPRGITRLGKGFLDFSNVRKEPIRAADVALAKKQTDGSYKDVYSTRTDANGNYTFTGIPLGGKYVVRVYARTKSTNSDTAKWDIKVVDNTRENALYALQSSEITATQDVLGNNLLAKLGREEGIPIDEMAYISDSARKSAPFSILDTMYHTVQELKKVDADISMPALTTHWSTKNTVSRGQLDNGQIGGSFYTERKIYLLGDINTDADEFDRSVIIHEFSHFFEDNVARSDSIGGPHSRGDLLDVRIAFGEGFSNAFSGIMDGINVYVDTGSVPSETNPSKLLQGSRTLSLESVDSDSKNLGWWSEESIGLIVFDLFDNNEDSFDGTNKDTVNLGFQPIYDILLGKQKTTVAMTSIFSFMTYLKEHPSAQQHLTTIDQMLAQHKIKADELDIYGSAQTDTQLKNGQLYTDILPNQTKEVCINDSNNTNGETGRNKLNNHKFLKFNAISGTNYALDMKLKSGYSETDFPSVKYYLFRKGKYLGAHYTDNVTTKRYYEQDVALASGVHIISVTNNVQKYPEGKDTVCVEISFTVE